MHIFIARKKSTLYIFKCDEKNRIPEVLRITTYIMFSSISVKYLISNECIEDLCSFREKFFIALIRLFRYVYPVSRCPFRKDKEVLSF